MSVPSLLPKNATAFELALEQSLAAQLHQIPVERIVTQWNPWTCPTELLGWLAWGLSVDEWDLTWSEQTQRQVIADSVEVHRHKGTLGSVQQALQAEGYTVQVTEQPYFRFNVTVRGSSLTAELYRSLSRRIADYQSARCHYVLQFGIHFQADQVQQLFLQPASQLVRHCFWTSE